MSCVYCCGLLGFLVLLVLGSFVGYNVACARQKTCTAAVTLAWNQTVQVFSQSQSGHHFISLRALLESTEFVVPAVDLYSSDNFSTCSQSCSDTHQWSVSAGLTDLVFARYALTGSNFSFNFTFPSISTRLSFYVLNTFPDYYALKNGNYPSPLHSWQVSLNHSHVEFEVMQNSYVFVVVNITASLNFTWSLHQQLNLFTPPSSLHMTPSCTLTSTSECDIPLSSDSEVLGVAQTSPAQAYPTLLTSASYVPSPCTATWKFVINISMSIVTIVACMLCTILFYCYRKRCSQQKGCI